MRSFASRILHFSSLGIDLLSNKSQKPGNRIMNSLHRYHLLNIHEKNTENSVLLPCQLSLIDTMLYLSRFSVFIQINWINDRNSDISTLAYTNDFFFWCKRPFVLSFETYSCQHKRNNFVTLICTVCFGILETS